MKRNDWIGLGASLALHALLLLIFFIVTIGAAEPEPIGFIEVDFGPITEGRPVQQAVAEQPEELEREPQPDPQPEPEAAPPEVAKPVKLPDPPKPVQDVDKVQTPETEKISPTTRNNPADVKKPDPKPESKPIRPLGGGTREGSTGAETGDDGPGQQETRTSPFQIEGLNRNTVYAPLPAYPEKVNADIKIRIKVDPQGRVVERFVMLKGNPSLEQAALAALQRWRFNALPTHVPQENQTGIITFRFRVQ